MSEVLTVDSSEGHSVIYVPREAVGDDMVRLVQWVVDENREVEPDQPLAVVETSKATFEIRADRKGFLFHLAKVGEDIAVGAPIALISDTVRRPSVGPKKEESTHGSVVGEQIITEKARVLIAKYDLSAKDFSGIPVLRGSDIENFLNNRAVDSRPEEPRIFADQELERNANWDTTFQSSDYQRLKEVMTALRQRMKANHDRHVPAGTLLYDRWELAKDYGFDEGTSVYDECLILGDVRVGKHCWIGPFTILDGAHASLTIGDYTSVGAGTHIYTHNTIEQALTGNKAAVFKKATSIGNCCFIAPLALIGPGTTVGDHSFVAAGSYVEGFFPSHSYIAGNPAKRVGCVEVQNKTARLRREM